MVALFVFLIGCFSFLLEIRFVVSNFISYHTVGYSKRILRSARLSLHSLSKTNSTFVLKVKYVFQRYLVDYYALTCLFSFVEWTFFYDWYNNNIPLCLTFTISLFYQPCIINILFVLFHMICFYDITFSRHTFHNIILNCEAGSYLDR